ncbi:chaplin [Streptomyces tagetis]|uniref:Chaplin n=1 Tax=Streptomyces tagetis TaxID=2820809 RepID=A0A941B045_9ACTN|nr:chaplin [Streptomyces sp. RG38]MBQ0826900.1 chaplin [Streptomyces sp. RG38]
MRRVTRTGVLAVAASGAMAVTLPACAAFAADGATADGTAAGSPGVLSGNTVQLPVDIPVNVCGNTVDVVGLLNPAMGNRCANVSDGGHAAGGGSSGGAVAEGVAEDSPGVLSGNGVQLPVHVPVNATGNSVNVVGIGNPVFGNESVNTTGERPERPQRPERPAPEPPAPAEHRAPPRPAPRAEPPQTTASLAHTGTDEALPLLAGGAALVLGGAVLYRRFRHHAAA